MKIKVQKSQKEGKGVFAARRINAGEKILDFSGKIEEIDRDATTPENVTSSIQVDCDHCLVDSGKSDDFVNHSCQPNAFVVFRNEHHSGDFITNDSISLFALNDIDPEEEITFDYSLTVCNSTWEMNGVCQCLALDCRQQIKSIHSLSGDRIKFYRNKGMVSGHMLSHLK